MDTNVILARFAPKDPLRSSAKSFFDSRDEKVISPISLVEMSAVLSRGNARLEVPELLGRETEARRVAALSEYFVEFLGIKIESISVMRRVRVGGLTLSLPLEYSEALKKAGELRLRALDLLHLVYAGLINSLRSRIDRFVTSDRGILERGKTIEAQFGYRVVRLEDTAR